MNEPAEAVLAAGAVVWRGDLVQPEVCLVHRPTYNDWTLPKGKVQPGEHILSCAAREVAEETGHLVTLGRPLPPHHYEAGGQLKRVRYWLAEADRNVTVRKPDYEVDDVAFLPAADALAQLTYRGDADLVRFALDGPLRTTALVLLRHTAALDRSAWSADDTQRPLRPAGKADADKLVAPLSTLGVTRVISSDAARCIDTVRPLAEHLGLPVEVEPLLSEDGARAAAPGMLAESVRSLLLGGSGSTLVCSHRPVLPGLAAAAGPEPGPPLSPGEFVVIHHHDGKAVATDRHTATLD